jgi:hypothetical protein
MGMDLENSVVLKQLMLFYRYEVAVGFGGVAADAFHIHGVGWNFWEKSAYLWV